MTKSYWKNRYSKIALAVLFFVFLSGAAYAGEGYVKIVETHIGRAVYNIYYKLVCPECGLKDPVNEKLLFYSAGKEADCACSAWNEKGECTYYLNENEKKQCLYKNKYGGSGTFSSFGNLAVGGDLAFGGFDASSSHWIMSGTEASSSRVLGFNKDGNEVYSGGDAYIGQNIDLAKPNSGIFAGNNSDRITTNEGDLIFNFDSSNILSLLRGEEENYRIQSTRLSVGNLKVDDVIFQGCKLKYYCWPEENCEGESSDVEEFIVKSDECN